MRLSSPRAVLPILQLIKAHGENLYRERFKLYQCFGTMAVIHSLNKIHVAVANPHISMSQSSTIPFLFVVFVSFFFPLKVLILTFASSGLQQGNKVTWKTGVQFLSELR